jgi:hypothetical protein
MFKVTFTELKIPPRFIQHPFTRLTFTISLHEIEDAFTKLKMPSQNHRCPHEIEDTFTVCIPPSQIVGHLHKL